MVPQSDELMGVFENFIFHMNVMRKTANEVNGGSLWLCRCTVCPISFTFRFNPDNAFILF